MQVISFCTAAALILGSASALAADHAHSAASTEAHAHAHSHGAAHSAATQQPWGIAAKSAAKARTITIGMTDDMRFSPAAIQVKLGETIRFKVENRGQVMHEIVLGTAQSLDEHAKMMLAHPDMAHGEAHMAHVAPGQSADLLWTFNRAGNFDFACLIAGHFQAGMRGTLTVKP